jgi:mevalonate kinase
MTCHFKVSFRFLQKDPAGVAAAAFIYLLLSIFAGHERIPAARVHIKSQLPIGAGLGSSAAYSVALAAALLVFSSRVGHGDVTSTDGETAWTGEVCMPYTVQFEG